MFLLNVMLFLKVLRVIKFLNRLLVASIMPSGNTNKLTVKNVFYFMPQIHLAKRNKIIVVQDVGF